VALTGHRTENYSQTLPTLCVSVCNCASVTARNIQRSCCDNIMFQKLRSTERDEKSRNESLAQLKIDVNAQICSDREFQTKKISL